MFPLTDELYGEIGPGDEADEFEKLSPGVEQWAQRISMASRLAYVEAEFFGGVGGQAAVAWSEGARALGPLRDQDAINQVLRFLGARADGAHDEFDAIDLGRHRDTSDWLEEEH